MAACHHLSHFFHHAAQILDPRKRCTSQSSCTRFTPKWKTFSKVFIHPFHTQIKGSQQNLQSPIFKPRQKAYKSPWTHFKRKCSQHSLHTPILIPDKWFITKSLYTYVKPRQKAHKSPYTHFKRRRKPFQIQTKAITNTDKSHFKRRQSQVFIHQFQTHMKGLQHGLHVHMSNLGSQHSLHVHMLNLDKRLTTEFVSQYPAGDKSALSQPNKQGFKVSRFYWAFGPWGLESEVTFAHDIPYEQVHAFY